MRSAVRALGVGILAGSLLMYGWVMAFSFKEAYDYVATPFIIATLIGTAIGFVADAIRE